MRCETNTRGCDRGRSGSACIVCKKPMNAIAGSAELITCSMSSRHAARLAGSMSAPSYRVSRSCGVSRPYWVSRSRGRFQVKLDIAASDIGPRMAQRQVTVDLLQLRSYSGSVAADTTIRHAGEERVRNN